MDKVMQTKFDQDGNCWPASVATMLGVSIEDVPEFNKWAKERKTSWYVLFEAWLMKEHNLFPLIIQHHVPAIHIAAGISPRGLSHVVIYRGSEMVHDPHPDGGGIETLEECYVFIPMEATMSSAITRKIFKQNVNFFFSDYLKKCQETATLRKLLAEGRALIRDARDIYTANAELNGLSPDIELELVFIQDWLKKVKE